MKKNLFKLNLKIILLCEENNIFCIFNPINMIYRTILFI